MTSMRRELRKSWAAATELLKERVEETLLAAELEIPGLISARLEAQNELSEQEADSALHGNEHSDRDLRTRSKLGSCREALVGAVARIAGLRKKRDAQLEALPAIRIEIGVHLDEFHEQAVSEFRREWATAKRFLERRWHVDPRWSDRSLDLLPPAASNEPVDLGELGVSRSNTGKRE
jgi:hypothetical protein